MATAMPQATFSLMPGVGHYALEQQAADFNKIVLDFLKDK